MPVHYKQTRHSIHIIREVLQAIIGRRSFSYHLNNPLENKHVVYILLNFLCSANLICRVLASALVASQDLNYFSISNTSSETSDGNNNKDYMATLAKKYYYWTKFVESI